jgi:transposase InsO family protein
MGGTATGASRRWLRNAGWPVGKDRVQRIWRREGLKVPQKQRPRGRLWLHDGSCIRLRPERANHVWSYDFVKAMTHDGRALRILVVIDEYTRECLALRVARRLGSLQVIETLADVMLVRGIPEHIRSDNGPEFIAEELRKWLGKNTGPFNKRYTNTPLGTKDRSGHVERGIAGSFPSWMSPVRSGLPLHLFNPDVSSSPL